jgi:O-acetyl-ADP-ribose deacetylase (regulator of RNase III)
LGAPTRGRLTSARAAPAGRAAAIVRVAVAGFRSASTERQHAREYRNQDSCSPHDCETLKGAMEWRSEGGKLLTLVVGDITRIPVDAIVNAANSALAGGGGVDGAIHLAGGPQIMQELDVVRTEVGGCKTGDAVATSAGNLPAKWVFHAVGPIYHGGNQGEAELLANCYRRAFQLANERSVRSISFPAISTGIYGYPMEHAAEIAVREILSNLRSSTTVVEATIVLFNREAYKVHADVLRTLEEHAS